MSNPLHNRAYWGHPPLYGQLRHRLIESLKLKLKWAKKDVEKHPRSKLLQTELAWLQHQLILEEANV